MSVYFWWPSIWCRLFGELLFGGCLFRDRLFDVRLFGFRHLYNYMEMIYNLKIEMSRWPSIWWGSILSP